MPDDIKGVRRVAKTHCVHGHPLRGKETVTVMGGRGRRWWMEIEK
jgi:hypothetical protein